MITQVRSDRRRVLITGATGNVGRHLVGLLRGKVDVRALTRNPSTADLPAEVHVVPGDMAAPGTLSEALDGIGAVYFVWPFAHDGGLAEAVDQMAARVERIVYLSSTAVRAHEQKAEQLIRSSGLDWTFLRPKSFASNTLRWAEPIRTAQAVREPYLGAAMALIHPRDVAAVAERALTEGGHAGAIYELTGPEALTKAEQVRIIGETIDRAVPLEEISPEEARRDMLAMGWPDHAVDEVLDAQARLVEEPDRTTGIVEEVTGASPRTLGSWVADNAHHFERRSS